MRRRKDFIWEEQEVSWALPSDFFFPTAFYIRVLAVLACLEIWSLDFFHAGRAHNLEKYEAFSSGMNAIYHLCTIQVRMPDWAERDHM